MRRTPDVPAVRDPRTGRTVSYGALWERAGRVAADLAGRGVVPGDLVALAMDRSVDLVVAMLGTLRAGAAYVPVDPQAPEARVATVLAESGARVVLGPGDSDGADGAPPSPVLGGDDPCYVIYTSGSTGVPKGVVVPHRAVVRLVSRAHYCVVRPGDRCANGANPAFDATTFEIWGALAAGGTVVVFPSVVELTTHDWVALVRSEEIDTMFLTTSLFHAVVRERPDAFSSLANLVVGGEQLELGAVRRVLGSGAPPRRLVNGYGPTETTTFAAYFECTPDSVAGVERVPIGFPLQDTTLHVLDDELRDVPPTEVGELCVGGPGRALGYLGMPELTAQRFVVADDGTPVYRTGDLARLLPGGVVEVLGRRDRQVKLRGFRIELEEIEQAATATGLCDAAVVEKVGDGPEAWLVGFALPAVGAGDVAARLGAELAERLPRYMLPARWITVTEVPYGPTGKLDRARLLALLDAPVPAVDEGSLGPAGDALRDIWRDVLATPHVGVRDNFLALGGNSLMAVQVATRVRHRLGVAVDPADVLLADSLADLVRTVS
ncbi:amino acid adenylation protein [Saccharothrix sp. ALI-22-I]|nr:amino acid adenylation protein [Saccharothrix sp. ALI-22-I]